MSKVCNTIFAYCPHLYTASTSWLSSNRNALKLSVTFYMNPLITFWTSCRNSTPLNKSNNIEFRSTAIGISLPKPIPIGESESNAILKKYPQTSSTHNYETDQELTLSSANRKSSRKVSVKMEVTEVSYAEVGIKTLEGEEGSRKI